MASHVNSQTRSGGERSIPSLSKLGGGFLLFGLLYDIVEHGMGQPSASGGFSVGEHTAHLLAFVGMVLVLVGVVAQGLRGAKQVDPAEDS